MAARPPPAPSADLAAAHAAAWDAFHDRQMVRKPFTTFEVCHCPVCVQDATLQLLVTTPVRAMTADLLSFYTHSAHGVPANARELFYFLPRYLELIAADDEPDRVNVGCVLLRLGDLRRLRPDDLSARQVRALDGWLRAYVGHVARADAAAVADPDAGLIATLWLQLDMFLAAGFPGPDIVAAYDAAFDDPGTGGLAFAAFCRAAEDALGGRYANPLYAVRHAAPADRLSVIAALTGPVWAALADCVLAGLADLDDSHRDSLRWLPSRAVADWQPVFHLDAGDRPLPER